MARHVSWCAGRAAVLLVVLVSTLAPHWAGAGGGGGGGGLCDQPPEFLKYLADSNRTRLPDSCPIPNPAFEACKAVVLCETGPFGATYCGVKKKVFCTRSQDPKAWAEDAAYVAAGIAICSKVYPANKIEYGTRIAIGQAVAACATTMVGGGEPMALTALCDGLDKAIDEYCPGPKAIDPCSWLSPGNDDAATQCRQTVSIGGGKLSFAASQMAAAANPAAEWVRQPPADTIKDARGQLACSAGDRDGVGRAFQDKNGTWYCQFGNGGRELTYKDNFVFLKADPKAVEWVQGPSPRAVKAPTQIAPGVCRANPGGGWPHKEFGWLYTWGCVLGWGGQSPSHGDYETLVPAQGGVKFSLTSVCKDRTSSQYGRHCECHGVDNQSCSCWTMCDRDGNVEFYVTVDVNGKPLFNSPQRLVKSHCNAVEIRQGRNGQVCIDCGDYHSPGCE